MVVALRSVNSETAAPLYLRVGYCCNADTRSSPDAISMVYARTRAAVANVRSAVHAELIAVVEFGPSAGTYWITHVLAAAVGGTKADRRTTFPVIASAPQCRVQFA